MLTDREIQDLIKLPKRITSRTPAEGYREEDRNKRCDLALEATADNGASFRVFIRQSIEFIENFSIGLRYQTGDRSLGTIVLVRYNGPHGETSRQPDGHFAKPHTHLMTEAELSTGNSQPQEREREFTNRYGTYEEALRVFFDDIVVVNYDEYFPESLQPRLFDGRH